MMLSHPVLLGLVWSLLSLSSTSGQSMISDNESNKVYSYSYHFLHNGTTNSKEILRSMLGEDPDFSLDSPEGRSIIKTFSSPGIKGFFTKGILPAGPIRRSFSNDINSPFSAIKKMVESNLKSPRNIASDLLPPISPDISKEFPRDFNNVNHIGNIFQNENDFPRIPPPPPPVLPRIQSNNDNRKVENFARDTPDGGRIVGRLETFSYNPPPVTNSVSRTEENSHGFRRNENILNNNQQITGHRTQTYFRQQFRTIMPNSESHAYNENNRIDSQISNGPNKNNQWWNALNVLGNRNINGNPPSLQLNNDIKKNINEIQNNINSAFGTRLSGLRRNSVGSEPNNNNYNQNYNNPLPIPNFNNRLSIQNLNDNPLPRQNLNKPIDNNQNFARIQNVPFMHTHTRSNQQSNDIGFPNYQAQGFGVHNRPNINSYQNNQISNSPVNNQYNKEMEKKVLNLIQDVDSQLKHLRNNNEAVNGIGPFWNDVTSVNNDWSMRQSTLNSRPFSNGNSGPAALSQPQPIDILKNTFDALMADRNFENPRNHDESYRNIHGGGVERFYDFDRTDEGPNSQRRNQHRRYEKDIRFNANSGYSRSNQWSTNTVRRLDAQGSKPDFSKDFIDVFRDD